MQGTVSLGRGLSANWLNTLFQESAAMNTFCLSEINAGSFTEAVGDNVLRAGMAWVYAQIKYWVLVQSAKPNPQDNMAITIGELFRMVVRNDSVLSTKGARVYFCRIMLRYIEAIEHNYDLAPPVNFARDDEHTGKYINLPYTQRLIFVANPGGGAGAKHPIYAHMKTVLRLTDNAWGIFEGLILNTEDVEATEYNADHLRQLTLFLLEVLEVLSYKYAYRNAGLYANCVYTTFLAHLKRGTVTDNKLARVIEAMRHETAVNADLTMANITRVWSAFGRYMSSDTVREVVNQVEQVIPVTGITLRNLVSQCAWSGLTVYVTIVKALTDYQDFNWDRIVGFPQYQTEMNHFLTAYGVVGNNQYYGFNTDLANVRSTLYKNLGSLCRDLDMELSGIRTLQHSRAFIRQYLHYEMIHRWIEAYAATRGDLAAVENIADNRVVIGRFNNLRVAPPAPQENAGAGAAGNA